MFEALASDDRSRRLWAIQKGAGYFKIARNFPTAFDVERKQEGQMRLIYLGDALDHWKGAILSHLVSTGQLTGLAVYPMATDATDWNLDDFELYAKLLRVPRSALVTHAMRLSTQNRAFPRMREVGDVFLDPDTGIATGKVKQLDQYVIATDIYRFLFNGMNRVVAVYQHVRAMRTRERVEQVISSLPGDTCWASYESPSVAMLFFSLAPWRIAALAGSLRGLLGRHAANRVFEGPTSVVPRDITGIAGSIGTLVVIVSRADVQRCDTTTTLAALSRVMESANVSREWEGRVDIAFHGYDDDPVELFEMPEVRNFVYALDAKFPHWLFFLTKEGRGLQAIAWCFLPPFLTKAAQRTVWAERIVALLEHRWIPALVDMCRMLGHSEAEIASRINAASHYFVEGPRLPFDLDKL